jgi:hypothetical protein
MSPHEWVPVELARHAATVMVALFLGFLCAFVVSRAKEKGLRAVGRWNGPVSLAWAVTVGCASMLIVMTFAGLVLQRPLTLGELLNEGHGAEVSRRSLGVGLFQVSVVVLPFATLCTWIGLLREARRNDRGPARHSPTVLGGLIVSAVGLLAFAVQYGPALLK